MKKIFILFLLGIFLNLQTPVWAVSSLMNAKSVQNSDNQLNDVFEDNNQQIVTNEQNNFQVELSPIEKIFNSKDIIDEKQVLRQAGYDLFNPMTSVQNSRVGKFDDSYKLSIGERVNAYLIGDSVDVMAISGSNLLSPVMNGEVDSKGNLFIQGIGMVKAESRPLSEVEAELNKLAKSKYKNLNIKLSIATGNEISVFVYGQVERPGKVLIGNNSSILDALSAANGVKKTGTLREIKYTSNNKTQMVDVYNALFNGDDGGIILKPNDKIFVGKIGNVVAIKNGVANPGIYEALKDESIKTLIGFSGGLLPNTNEAQITLTGFTKSSKNREARNIEWENIEKTILSNADTIEFKGLYNEVENTVTLQGNIKYPATYAYKEGMHLSDILKSEDELLEETFLHQAVIRRVTGKDKKVEIIPVFLNDFFAGISDPKLQPKDVISIYKNTNAQFIDVYGCINNPKHLTYIENMKLSDVMTDISFIETIKEGTVTANNETTTQEEKTLANTEAIQGETVALNANAESYSKLIPASNVAVEITDKDDNIQLYYLYDIMINSDKIKTIKINPSDKIFFRTLRDNEVVKTVKISGFVKNPTVFTFVEGKRLTDIIEMAGGLTKEADLRGIVYKRSNLQAKQVQIAKSNADRDIKLLEGRLASGYKQAEADQKSKLEMIKQLEEDKDTMAQRYTGQIALNIKNNDLSKISKLNNIFVQDGDDIYIPKMSNHVSVIGEVFNEQSFVYKKGAKARYYINEIGGYTQNANKFRMYKIGVNGRAEKIGKGSLIEAGDTIVVPRKIAGNDWISPLCSTLTGIAAIFSTIFMVTKL